MRAQAQITITVISDGLDAAISSDTPPEDTSRLWLDTSVNPPILKRYNGANWEPVNQEIIVSPDPPDNPSIGQQWMDIADNDNPILKIYVEVGLDAEGNPLYDWVPCNGYNDLQTLKDAYTDLTSDEWIAHVGEQVLQSDSGKELVRQSELTAELQLLKDQLNVTLEQMSGYNLLLNSVGWNGTNMWEADGGIAMVDDNDVKDHTTSGRAFRLDAASMSQTVKVRQGAVYTVSCLYKTYTSASSLKVIQGGAETVVFETTAAYVDDEWHEASLVIQAAGTELTVAISSSASYLMISDLILNEGSIKKQWTPHTDEIYTAGVKIDKTGIEIEQSDTDTITKIDSTEFSVIDKNSGEKVLRVNRDTTELTKLRTTSAEIGKLMITNSDDGFVFVSVMD
jgi:hypothetical protein|nr:MAG TPA: Minor structural protein putative tail fiber [Caudoviricetes sp.]